MTDRGVAGEMVVPNVHYVTRNGHTDDSGGGYDALTHLSLRRSALQTDEIRLHSASSHMHSSSDTHFQLPLSNPYHELQDARNPQHPEAVPVENDPVPPLPHCHAAVHDTFLQQLGIDGSNRFLLYTLILFVTTIVFINSALIVWIMSIMDLSPVCVIITHTPLFPSKHGSPATF